MHPKRPNKGIVDYALSMILRWIRWIEVGLASKIVTEDTPQKKDYPKGLLIWSIVSPAYQKGKVVYINDYTVVVLHEGTYVVELRLEDSTTMPDIFVGSRDDIIADFGDTLTEYEEVYNTSEDQSVGIALERLRTAHTVLKAVKN